ncbi:MAG: fibronectin type III domain-containing protein [Acidobacteriales bacterium]|nr:fibronectin type III domain-containing protein [Terriglobales bacterium]
MDKTSLPQTMSLGLRKVHRYMVASLVLGLLALSMSGVAGAASPRTLRIIQVYSTAETTTSASVVWNTNVASDSLIQYSTTNPVPASAPTLYSAAQVTYHEFSLTGLTPGTLYHFKVTSCAKRACPTATGNLETFPSCPDTVPPVSGNWQKVTSASVNGVDDQELLGIAAISENDVWAVGWAKDPAGPQYVKRTLIEHFDGNAWSIVPSPNWPQRYYQ